MWQIWISGILGLWVILLAFLDFSSTLTMFFLIATGTVLAVINFWMLTLIKAPQRRHPDFEILPPEPPESVPVKQNNESARESENNTPQNN